MKRAVPGRTGMKQKQTANFGVLTGNFPASEEIADIWNQCHGLLAQATPLATDCGRLCTARCCSGGPEDGMLLFPGEELLYQEGDSISDRVLPGNWHLLDSSIMLPDMPAPIQLLVCDGQCIRARRPFSCRIFPLLPWVDRRGRIRVRPDLRAAAGCPLLFDDSLPPIRQEFAEAVREAFALAIPLPGVRTFLDLLNEETEVLRKFHGMTR